MRPAPAVCALVLRLSCCAPTPHEACDPSAGECTSGQSLLQLRQATKSWSPEESVAPGNLTAVHLVYASTAHDFTGLLSSMLSVSEHLADPGGCFIHLYTSASNMARIAEVVDCFYHELAKSTRGTPTVLVRETPTRPSVEKFIESCNGQQFTGRHDLLVPETFVRLFLHEYLPSAARALWLDTDTIATSDVTSLFRIDMEHALAAVPYKGTSLKAYVDGKAPEFDLHQDERRLREAAIFNTGVLVLDLARLRSGGATKAFEDYLDMLRRHDTEADQLVMNVGLMGEYDQLDSRWNLVNLGLTDDIRRMMDWGLVPDADIERSWILHWTGLDKPWLPGSESKPYHRFYQPYDRQRQCKALAAAAAM